MKSGLHGSDGKNEKAGKARQRRGRPRTERDGAGRRGAGPTHARLIAVRVLERVERARAFADLTLHQALTRSPLSGPDRALCTELVYGTLRWRGHLDHLLGQVLERDVARLDSLVRSCLRLGAYQLIFSRVPDTAAVDESVRCARALGAERATGMVNAVLRRLAREAETLEVPDLESDPLGHLVHALSLPEWIARRWLAWLGPQETAALAQACNEAPRLSVRANPLRASAESLLAELRPRFPDASRCQWSSLGVDLGRRGQPGRDPAFLAGHFTVQDQASQLVIDLLDPQPGDHVLDTCAAPGTKATGAAERVGDNGSVLALDRHSRRLALVARDARRLGLRNLSTQNRDSSVPLSDLCAEGSEDPQGRFDRVLVDAPCSGLGTLRRNPDARWRVRPGDPASLAVAQGSILSQGAERVRPGGRLVYSTCTLLPEENEELVQAFLAESGEFRVVPSRELPARLFQLCDEQGFMRCLPHHHDTDGFFAACLERLT